MPKLKPITFEPFGILSVVFTVVLRRMSSIILFMSFNLYWGLFKFGWIRKL